MYLRKVTYQLGVPLKRLLPCFHKSHVENLVLLVVGIAYGRSVSLPKAAAAVLTSARSLRRAGNALNGCCNVPSSCR